MANETEVIRERMEDARNDLSDKIEQLEKQVVSTVQDATAAVSDAVQSAKDVVESVQDSVEGTVASVKGAVEGTVDSVNQTFHDTVQSVKDTFDLPRQMDRHPWLMVGGAVAVGFVAGKLLDYAPEAARTTGRMAASLRPTAERFTTAAASTAGAVGAAASTAGSVFSMLERMFGPELNKVKELALGAALGMVRDAAVQAAPETLRPQVQEIIDGFTSKLGGKPVEGSVLGPKPSEEEVSNGPRSRF
jgi:ElaB/YqjD/DUF883 family membrane-anchored ribosome-binding protein